jgi:glycine cleavage system H lipoate-binding protein
MTCPFLAEKEVRFCLMAGRRKMIPLAGSNASAFSLAVEKCTSPAFVSCPVFQKQEAETAAVDRCPWLQESLMQYCAAAPVTKFVPYSESSISRCGTDSFRYCDLYLAMAHPEADEEDVDGVRMPRWLRYTYNHMWLDVGPDGRCHAGIDGFLARALGTVEKVSYVWMRGDHRPAAVLTAGDAEIEAVFPNPMRLTGCNLYLRADPGRCTAEPYTAGWLFEGELLPETTEGLRDGETARQWMRAEHGRMNEFIHEHLLPPGTPVLAGDGGVFSPGLVRSLERDKSAALSHTFFAPFSGPKRTP